MNLSTKNISFLKDINTAIKVDMSSGWRHHYFDDLTINEILTFIRSIKDDKIYYQQNL